jgi:hypothetical protein
MPRRLNAEDYRDRAARCRLMAQQMSLQADRQALEATAREYDRLASELEQAEECGEDGKPRTKR